MHLVLESGVSKFFATLKATNCSALEGWNSLQETEYDTRKTSLVRSSNVNVKGLLAFAACAWGSFNQQMKHEYFSMLNEIHLCPTGLPYPI